MTSRQQLYAAGEPLGDSATRMKPGGRIYGGGGSGGGTSTTTQSIPDELKPLASAYTNKAIGLSNQGFQPYSGQRNADLNYTQNLGIGMAQNRALNGDATVNAGAQSLQRQLNSGPMGATANAFGNVSAGVNNSNVSAQNNPYAQQGNPYLDAMVNKAQASVLGTANQAAVRSGSFGNSGIAEQAAGKMGEVATNMYGNAYGQQAQLAEGNASRNLQSQQFNSGVADGNIGRNMQAQQFNAQQGNDFASRNDQANQNYASNNMNAANLGLQYGNQGYQDANQLMRAGQTMQNQDQNNRDFDFQQFTDQQNLPYKQLAAMSGVFNSNLGSKSTTTQSGGGGK